MDIPLYVYTTKQTLAKSLATHLLALATTAIKDHGYFAIAVSGGSMAALLDIGLPSIASQTQFPLWKWFFADERLVELNHQDSNMHGYRALFQNLAIPATNIYAISVPLLDDGSAAALDYETRLRGVLGNSMQLDLVLLGMGPDGHTCSLFPSHHLLTSAGMVEYISDSPKPPPRRITMTLRLVNRAHEALFIVTGGAKKKTISEVMTGTGGYPASFGKTGESWYGWLIKMLHPAAIFPLIQRYLEK